MAGPPSRPTMKYGRIYGATLRAGAIFPRISLSLVAKIHPVYPTDEHLPAGAPVSVTPHFSK